MTISIYKTSMPIFVQFPYQHIRGSRQGGHPLRGREDRTGRAPQHAALPRQFPLARQPRAVTDHAISATARARWRGTAHFSQQRGELLRAQGPHRETIDFIKSFKPQQIHGTEDKEILVKFSTGERKFNWQTFLLNFWLPIKISIFTPPPPTTPAPLRHRARQARLHGNAGNALE